MDPLFQEVADRCLDTALALGASHAEVRVLARRDQELTLASGQGLSVREEETAGFGVRVLVDGCWGYAASEDLSGAGADRAAARAVALARAGARLGGHPVRLAPAQPRQASAVTPGKEDPFAVSLEEKVALLRAAAAEMGREPLVVRYVASVHCRWECRLLATGEGTRVYQEWHEAGGGLEVTASGHGEVQRRSYPNLFGWHASRGGYECVRALNLPAAAARAAAEAAQLLTAPPCPEGTYDVILLPSMLAIQLHESIGHAVELDRALGREVAAAGGTFLTPDRLGSPVAAPCVTIVADATIPEGLGSFLCDDEGEPGRRVPLVEQGVFVGYLSTRETAALLGGRSAGCARADSWQRPPLLRMTNVNMEPGPWRLEDLIAQTDRGLVLDTCRSWSIDHRRYHFQFGAELAREIRGGRLGRLYRNPVYAGVTPEFWQSCDAVTGEVQDLGVNRCFKGQPGQMVRVTHRVPAARFRRVQVWAAGGRSHG